MQYSLYRKIFFLTVLIFLARECVAFRLTPSDEQGLKSAKESCAAYDAIGGDSFEAGKVPLGR